MKAVYLTGVKKFEIRDIDSPMPGDKDIVVDVKACGVCGSDIRRWKAGPNGEDYISGHEVSGVVSAAGRNVKKYAVGDRIAIAPDIHCGECYYCRHALFNLCENLHLLGITPGYPGGFAEKMIVTEEVLERGVSHRIPDELSFDHAAISEPCSSVLACHDQMKTGIGDVVLVMGAGPIGCIHIAVANARGAKVIISQTSKIRRELAKSFMPQATVDPLNEDLGEVVRSMTDGRGVDIAICANPVPATQTQAVELVRKRGKVVLFGGLPKSNNMVPYDGNLIHYNEIEVVGSFSYHPDFHALALDALARGIIPGDKLITHEFKLDNIDEALNTAAGGSALKVLVKP